jgi:hypothetical protein
MPPPDAAASFGLLTKNPEGAVSKPMFFFAGVYETREEAERDYDAIKRLHHVGEIGSYDAAVLTKKPDGDVGVSKDEKPVRQRGSEPGSVTSRTGCRARMRRRWRPCWTVATRR